MKNYYDVFLSKWHLCEFNFTKTHTTVSWTFYNESTMLIIIGEGLLNILQTYYLMGFLVAFCSHSTAFAKSSESPLFY